MSFLKEMGKRTLRLHENTTRFFMEQYSCALPIFSARSTESHYLNVNRQLLKKLIVSKSSYNFSVFFTIFVSQLLILLLH